MRCGWAAFPFVRKTTPCPLPRLPITNAVYPGTLPEWPYKWPPLGYERLRRNAPDMVEFLRRALEVSARKRFRDGQQMLDSFSKAKITALRRLERRRRRR